MGRISSGKPGKLLAFIVSRKQRFPILAFFLISLGVKAFSQQVDYQNIISSGNTDDVRAIVRNLNLSPNQYGWTWLMDAAQNNPNLGVINLLIDAGLDVNARAHSGFTPLMAAASKNQNPEVVNALIRNGASIDAQDNDGWTALMFAAFKNPNWRITAVLIQSGASIELANNKGSTPLMQAAWKNNSEVVQVLLNAGADATAKNSLGGTVLSSANENPAVKNSDVYQRLVAATTMQICFWSNGQYRVDVYVDGSYVGKLTQYFSSGSPLWGQNGTLVVNETAGNHTIVGKLENGTIIGAPTPCTLSSSVRRMLWCFPENLEIAAANQRNGVLKAADAMGNLSSMANSAAGITGNNKFRDAGQIFSGAQNLLNIVGGN